MSISRSPCLIQQSTCGRTAHESVCAKCGLDTRVRYVSEEAAVLAKAQAQARYWKKHAENIHQYGQTTDGAANDVSISPVELAKEDIRIETTSVSKDEQNNADAKLKIWHAQLASKIGRSGDGELNFELYKEHFLKEWMDCDFIDVYKKRFDAALEKYGPYYLVILFTLTSGFALLRYYEGKLILSFENVFSLYARVWILVSILWFVVSGFGVLFSMKNFRQDRLIAISDEYRKYINQVNGRI